MESIFERKWGIGYEPIIPNDADAFRSLEEYGPIFQAFAELVDPEARRDNRDGSRVYLDENKGS